MDSLINMEELTVADTEGINFVKEPPEIYTMEEMSMDDRFNIYQYEIFQNCLCSSIDSALVSYIVDHIEPIGWKAIWRSNQHSTNLQYAYDFLVEVDDVSRAKLVADVRVIGVLQTSEINFKELKSFIAKSSHEAPLIELFVVFDSKDGGQFDRTAFALSNVRFFYDYIWRPWDDDDEDYFYADRFLKERLKLYYDMKNGVIPINTASEIRALLEEANELHWRIEKIQREMNSDDLDIDLKSEDIINCVKLSNAQDTIRKQLQLLENPVLSCMLNQEKSPIKPCPRGKRDNDEAVIHIVGKKFTVSSIQEHLIKLPIDSVVEFHNSFMKCLSEIYEGDTILLLPGVYACEQLNWLDESISIKGLGNYPSDTVIEAIGNGDVFVNCAATNCTLSNLKFKLTRTISYAITVHRGTTTIDRCEISGALIGISVISGAHLLINDSCIQNAEIAGVEGRLGSNIHLKSCKILNCAFAGIVLQVLCPYGNNEEDECIVASIDQSEISFNGNYGLILSAVDIFELHTNSQFETGNSRLLKKFNNHTINVTKNHFEKNKVGDIAIATKKGLNVEITNGSKEVMN